MAFVSVKIPVVWTRIVSGRYIAVSFGLPSRREAGSYGTCEPDCFHNQACSELL